MRARKGGAILAGLVAFERCARMGLAHSLMGLACALLATAGSASGAERFRTPAEIEIRRAEVAARLSELAAEVAALQSRLAALGPAAAEAPDMAAGVVSASEYGRVMARLEAVGAERDALIVEAAALAAIPTRSATGPMSRADPPGLVPAQITAPAPGSTGQVAAGNAFNPAITVIPSGLYYNDTRGGAADRIARGADGFVAPGADVESVSARGFLLGEVELTFSGAVDPYFDFWGTFAIADGAIEVEEAYVQTRRFIPGVQVRFGHFLSGVGYVNRQHAHQWDFVDQALPYATLFGDNLAETGVQVTWLPALPVYTQLGFEALQGENRLLANRLLEQYPESLVDSPGPRLFTGFVKVSPDLGYAHTLQAGASFGRSGSHQEATDDSASVARDGTAWFFASDWVWRFDSSRPFGERDLTLQGEYLHRVKAFDPVTPVFPDARASRQDGAYVQAVYGIGPRWTLAGRVDVIGLRNIVDTGSLVSERPASSRYSTNVTFNPTEFSRVRVQYNHGNVSQDAGRVRFDQVFVQFQMSLGVHGAHRF
jgi:hypothetical protein